MVEVFLGSGTTLGLPYFVQVVYTTGGWPLIGHVFLTVSNDRMTVLQTLVWKQSLLTSTHLWQPLGKHVAKRPIP